jgi:hypothetical protein
LADTVKNRNPYLMAELIVAALELLIWNPNGQTAPLAEHTHVNVLFQLVIESIGKCPQSANPELLLHSLTYTIYSVLQAAITMGIRFHMPRLRENRCIIWVCTGTKRVGPTSGRATLLAAETRGPMRLRMGSLMGTA